jgi:hypothetical protein
MAPNNRSTGGRSAGSAVARELDQLRKKVKELTLRLQREAKARKLDARLAAVAKKGREQMTKEIKALREQGRNLGSQLKSRLGESSKREQALQEARAKLAELKVELGRKTADLRRKSGELKQLAGESAHRAAAIIRGDAEHATEPVEAEPAAPSAPSELVSEGHIREIRMEDPFRRPTFGSALFYKDPFAALDWLEKAFGFTRSMVITDKDGKLGHSEMKFGDGYIMVGSEWADFVASPGSVDGKNTQTIHVHLKEGIDGSLRARSGGRRGNCSRADGSVLWRPQLHGEGSGRSCLELRSDCATRLSRGGGKSERTEDRGMVLSTRTSVDRVLATLS